MINHYETLGLKIGATSIEITKAYRKLALKFHPDKNEGDEFLMEMFKKINEAHSVLNDPLKKAKYDSELSEFFTTGSNQRPSSQASQYKASSKGNPDQDEIRVLILNSINKKKNLNEKLLVESKIYEAIRTNKLRDFRIELRFFIAVTVISFIVALSSLSNLSNQIISNIDTPRTSTPDSISTNPSITKKKNNKTKGPSITELTDKLTNVQSQASATEEDSLSSRKNSTEDAPKKEILHHYFAKLSYSFPIVTGDLKVLEELDGKDPKKAGFLSKSFFNKKVVRERLKSLLGAKYHNFELLTESLGESSKIKISEHVLSIESHIRNNYQNTFILVDLKGNKFYVSSIENVQSELTIYSESKPTPSNILKLIASHFNEVNGDFYKYISTEFSVGIYL